MGCHINNSCINHLCYADDAVLIAPSPSSLQHLINICHEYAKNNEISYNDRKTKCMFVKPKILKDLSVPNMYIDNKKLSWADEQKYLGVFLNSERSDCKDMMRELRSIYARGNLLLRNFRKCNSSVKEHIFKSYFSVFHCNQLWTDYTVNAYRKVKTAFNNVFRLLMGIPKTTRCSISKEFVMRHIDSV